MTTSPSTNEKTTDVSETMVKNSPFIEDSPLLSTLGQLSDEEALIITELIFKLENECVEEEK